MEKATGAVENATAGGWPGGEDGWRAAALEHGGKRGRQPVRRDGERRGSVDALEHTRSGECCGGVVMLERVRLCRWDGGAVNGEERRRAHEQIRLGERICKWRVGLVSWPINGSVRTDGRP